MFLKIRQVVIYTDFNVKGVRPLHLLGFIMLDRKELESKATGLGIQFNAQWKDETLAKKVEEAELALLEKQTDPENEDQGDLDLGDAEAAAAAAAAAKPKAFVSICDGVFICAGTRFKPKQASTLNEEQMSTKEFKHAIKTGILKAV